MNADDIQKQYEYIKSLRVTVYYTVYAFDTRDNTTTAVCEATTDVLLAQAQYECYCETLLDSEHELYLRPYINASVEY